MQIIRIWYVQSSGKGVNPSRTSRYVVQDIRCLYLLFNGNRILPSRKIVFNSLLDSSNARRLSMIRNIK